MNTKEEKALERREGAVRRLGGKPSDQRGREAMRRSKDLWIGLLVASLVLGGLLGCGGSHQKGPGVVSDINPAATTAVGKIKVVDVSNQTKELFDVDVIGLLWSSLDNSLLQRGLLWSPNSPNSPLTLEASIVKYQKGNYWTRNVLPFMGKSVLVAHCELKDGDRVVAKAEAEHTISAGTLERNAWRNVFSVVADELVTQLARQI